MLLLDCAKNTTRNKKMTKTLLERMGEGKIGVDTTVLEDLTLGDLLKMEEYLDPFFEGGLCFKAVGKRPASVQIYGTSESGYEMTPLDVANSFISLPSNTHNETHRGVGINVIYSEDGRRIKINFDRPVERVINCGNGTDRRFKRYVDLNR